MLQEHVEIIRTLDTLGKVAKTYNKKGVLDFVKKLKNHARIEEDLTYPAVLMAGKLLKQT